MRRAAKIDANQPEIVAALRAVGCSVQTLAMVGKGCPDILVGIGKVNLLMEIKGEKGTLTDDQEDWHEAWRGQLAIVRSVEEALALVDAVRRRAIERKEQTDDER